MSLSGAEMILIRDGHAASEIVLRENPTSSAQMAAFELTHHIQRITGVEIPVVRGKGTPGKIWIELGMEEQPFEREFSAISFSPDRIRIYGYDSPVYEKVNYTAMETFPAGSKGTLFAVYDFLEHYCGLRWYGLTEDATAFLPRKTLSVTMKEHEHSPKVDAFRSMYNSGGRPETLKAIDYTPRDEALLRLRWRNVSFFGQTNHNLYRIFFFYWDKAKTPQFAGLFKGKHPEYFAQGYNEKMAPLDGFLRREYPKDADCPPGICFSSKEVVHFFADQAVEQWKGLPMVGLPSNGVYQKRLEGRPFFSSVQHMDTQGKCFCAECRKKADAIGENNLMWQWIADIAEAAAKKQPGIGISTLAYQRSLAYPENVKLPENLCVQICLGIHSWWNPEFYKIQHDEIYKRWMDNKGNRVMTCWLYVYSPGWDSKTRYKHKFFPGVYPRHAGMIVKDMVSDGMRGYFMEVEMARNMLEAYVISQLFYDPGQNVDALLDEYYQLYYGSSAPEMKAFFTELEDIFWNWKNYPPSMFGKNGIANRLRHHSLGTGMLNADNNWSVGTADRMKRLSSLIDEAEKKADSSLVKKRISWIRKGFWDQAVEGKRDQERREKTMKVPVKNIVIPQVPDAGGNPDAVKWANTGEVGACHTLEDGDIRPGCFQLKLAADKNFLYLDFLEKKPQENPGFWTNFFEIFFSADGNLPIAQIALNPSGEQKELCYLTNIINDVSHIQNVSFDQEYRLLENKGQWHWRMAIPLKKLFGNHEIRQFRMNFRRFSPEAKLVWNNFFASAAECVGKMGYVTIRGAIPMQPVPLEFREGRIRGEIGSWYLPQGTIRAGKIPGTAEVHLKSPKDALAYAEKLPAFSGDTVRIIFKCHGNNVPAVSLNIFAGERAVGYINARPKELPGGKHEVVFELPSKEGITSVRPFFSLSKAGEFELSDVFYQIAGKGRQ